MVPQQLADVLLPVRDARLARVIAAMSEPDGGKVADNFVTNEDSFGRVGDALREQAPRDGVYLGVGPDQNLSYVAQCRPALAIIVDFRRRNALVHLLHKALIALEPERVGYLARLTARAPGALPAQPTAADLVAAFAASRFDRGRLDRSTAEVLAYLAPLGLLHDGEADVIRTIASRLAGPGLDARFLQLPIYPTLARLIEAQTRDHRPAHFLADDASYQTVRAVEQGDRLVPVVGDFAGPKAVGAIADLLRQAGRRVAVLYVSDVEFFLLRSGRFPAYIANLDRLPWADGAVIVRTSTREIDHPERVAGDSSTTIIRPVAPFLERGRAGAIRTDADLFA